VPSSALGPTPLSPTTYPGRMAAPFHRPALFGGREFEAYEGAQDPATVVRIAHESAAALLARVRGSEDPAVVERIIHYTDGHGIDALAELWAQSSADTLPGALWRLFLVRLMIRNDPEGSSLAFVRGAERLRTIDEVVAGAPSPAGPQEIVELADQILRGVFDGDLSLALERAAAFCRLAADGSVSLADDVDVVHPERAGEHDKRAHRLAKIGTELRACARLARDGALE